MRQLLVRLGLDPSAFNSGLRRAAGSWQGFKGEFINIGRAIESFVGNLAASIANRLIGAIAAIPRAITGLFEGAINAALSEERLATQMRLLTGSTEQATEIMERLDEWVLRVGADGDQAEAALGDIAKALRTMNGEVDPDLLFQYMDQLQLLATAFGRTPAEISEAFGRAITGDVQMLSRALGISQEQLAEMSPTFAHFIEQSQQAQDEQLGAVTRIVGGANMQAADAEQIFRELLEYMGLAEGGLEAFGATAQAEINRFNEALDQLQEELGAELLPILTAVLHEINTLIADNREEIHAFIESFGDFVADEWVALVAALQTVDWASMQTAGVAFFDTLQGIDWAGIAETLNAMIEFTQGVEGRGTIGERFQEQPIMAAAELAVGAGSVPALTQTSPETLTAITDAITTALMPLVSGLGIHLTFDDSLRPHVERISRTEASAAVGSVVDGMRRGGRSRQQ